MSEALKVEGVEIPRVVKLHLGAGTRIKEGYVNVDILQLDPQIVVVDLLDGRWPWADGTVDEILMEHTLEHFEAIERIHVVNEMYRVLKKGGKAIITCPYWGSARAYGDPTHKWPPVCEWTIIYFDKAWRLKEAPHTDISNWPLGYDCDFEGGFGYGMSKNLANRSAEYQKMALMHFKEAANDLTATLTKR